MPGTHRHTHVNVMLKPIGYQGNCAYNIAPLYHSHVLCVHNRSYLTQETEINEANLLNADVNSF